MIESDEFFSRFRPRKPEDGLSVPLQLQLLEGDHVDEAHNAMAPSGNEIRMGISSLTGSANGLPTGCIGNILGRAF